MVLTAPVVAEYLAGAEDERQRKRDPARSGTRYRIVPTDARAARIAADLRGDRDFLRNLGRDTGKSRVCLKADILIVATAAAHGVGQIVTADRDVRAIADRCGLPMRGLEDPDPPAAPGPPVQSGSSEEE